MVEVAFATLASKCFDRGYKLFKYRPKFHLGCHVALDIEFPVSVNPCCTLPLHYVFFGLLWKCNWFHGMVKASQPMLHQGTATWADEDYIGRVSRTARSVHPMNQCLRTIEKCLGQYAQQIDALNL